MRKIFCVFVQYSRSTTWHLVWKWVTKYWWHQTLCRCGSVSDDSEWGVSLSPGWLCAALRYMEQCSGLGKNCWAPGGRKHISQVGTLLTAASLHCHQPPHMTQDSPSSLSIHTQASPGKWGCFVSSHHQLPGTPSLCLFHIISKLRGKYLWPLW